MTTSSHLEAIQNLSYGMDILILSVTSPHEELFWQKRLDTMRGQVIKEQAKLITICEDWEGGAGNALGTFYAFLKANQKAQRSFQINLLERLEQGDSIGLYHTAGKGTRLAPMTGCEYNSKSRIKLVGKLLDKNTSTPITLLEATLKQTSIFAPKRKGRLSVFWGDQLFIPSNPITETDREIDLLIKTLPKTPDRSDWRDKGYDKYGLVLVDTHRGFKQLEKLSFEKFEKVTEGVQAQVGLSLGSFSLSKEILQAFLEEFKPELETKKQKLDTDPHLWMPLSLTEETYLQTLKTHERSFLKAHYHRMQVFKDRFVQSSLLGSTDMGAHTLWWDYGNTQAFLENSLKMTQGSEEGRLMRTFFSIPSKPENHIENSELIIENSCLINCRIQKGKIRNSVLINVVAEEVDLEGAVLIQTTARKIDAKSSILYNVAENGPLSLEGHQVRSDIFSEENGHIRFHNSILSPTPWEQCAKGNPFSFAKLHQIIQGLHPSEGQQCAQTAHNKVKHAVINLKIHNQE